MPRKPTIIAVHRLIPTLSDRKMTERSVAKIGTVKSNVVASASVIKLRPVKTQSIPVPPTAPLIICSLKDDVTSTLLPKKMSAGDRIKSTRDALKNVMTNGCMFTLSSLTDACIIVIETPPITIKQIAFDKLLLMKLDKIEVIVLE